MIYEEYENIDVAYDKEDDKVYLIERLTEKGGLKIKDITSNFVHQMIQYIGEGYGREIDKMDDGKKYKMVCEVVEGEKDD